MKKSTILSLGAVASVALVSVANAQLVRIGAGSFTPAATVITFSEFAVNTVNPHYSLAAGSLGTVDVDFEGHFVGQSTGPGPGSAITLADATPVVGPLTLDAAAPDTFITTDGANPTSPVLSGSPRFNGPVSILFSTPVAAVGLDGGFFDAVGSMSIEAYDANGASIGIVSNTTTGIEFFGLADASGGNVIKGISFYITGNEPAGFAIDNLTFGAVDVVDDPNVDPIVPEPSAIGLLGFGFIATLVGLRRRR